MLLSTMALKNRLINEYWNNKREGIYVDVVSGEVLFLQKTSLTQELVGQVYQTN